MEEDFDPDNLSDQELLVLPLSNIDPAKLARVLARRSEIIEKKDAEQAALEMTPGYRGPHAAPAATAAQQQLTLQQFLVTMEDFRNREDRLYQQVFDEHRETLRHLQDIDDRAIKLRDGRRAYVDGGDYRDRDGVFLRGTDRVEADRLKTGTSSTWAEQSHYETVNENEIGVLRKMQQDTEKLDTATKNAGSFTEAERADLVEREKQLLKQRENEAADLQKSYSDDYASAYDTAQTSRTASFAATMDGSQNRNGISEEFASASAGQPGNGIEKTRAPAAPSPLPVPGSPAQ